MSFRRAHSNYVNLGRLYSIPPWGTMPLHGMGRPLRNPVNLGNLYSSSQTKSPPGWAYFEDGSVLILPFGWCSHDVFEARMKIIAHFVGYPTPKMQQIRATRTPMKRFIVIDKNGNNVPENMLRILARNAQDGQRVSVVDTPFEDVELSLDPTGTRPVGARFSDAPQLRYDSRLRNSQALETFRGTLVDGVLQPNVRLGNGLRLSSKPEILKPQLTAKRRARNDEANKRKESAHLISKAPEKPSRELNISSLRNRTQPVHPDKSPSPLRKSQRDLDLERRESHVARRERELVQLQQQLLRTTRAQSTQPYQGKSSRVQRQQTHEFPVVDAKTEPDPKIADIEARERALEQKEELLRYKRKIWLLEQKLAKATARSLPKGKFSKHETDMQERNGNVYEETGADHEARPDLSYNNPDGEQLNNYSLYNPSPPKALESLRSRIRLPTKRMMRSNWKPGY